MKAIKLSRKTHKWIGLVLGIQLFLWALSGFYMVAVHIDIIHGDMLVDNMQGNIDHGNRLYLPLRQLTDNNPGAQSITLQSMMDRAVYLIEGQETILLDAVTGEQLSPLDEQTATAIAKYHYMGDAPIRRVELLVSDPPTELQARSLPLWRIDFDDAWNSSFYIDPSSSEFKTRRHSLWRIFDFFWMLHVMDYDERSDINNLVLRIFSVFGTFLGLSGVWLLFYSFGKNPKQSAVR